jgi:hypothetical protein
MFGDIERLALIQYHVAKLRRLAAETFDRKVSVILYALADQIEHRTREADRQLCSPKWSQEPASSYTLSFRVADGRPLRPARSAACPPSARPAAPLLERRLSCGIELTMGRGSGIGRAVHVNEAGLVCQVWASSLAQCRTFLPGSIFLAHQVPVGIGMNNLARIGQPVGTGLFRPLESVSGLF